MSNWTHVAGIIRVDSFRLDPLDQDFWKRNIGRECTLSSPKEVWDEAFDHGERFMPMGSEGSLHMEVWENPDKSRADAYTVSIFGDLRDHHDPDNVIEWFRETCRCLAVRNAVIEVRNEWCGTKTWSWNAERDEMADRGIKEILDKYAMNIKNCCVFAPDQEDGNG